eukprot:964633-Karenia_brevis.AAC.1
MLRNVIETDWAAQKLSLLSQTSALILFDFRAAFPSMSHEFIWQVLKTTGIPDQIIKAIQGLYKLNKHSIKLAGALFEGPTVASGVRQGCPLSGI